MAEKCSLDLYDKQSNGTFISPFKLEYSPMERLILINIEKDPDDIYIGFEPQYLDESEHGKGLLIIGWRTDGKVDVYHQPSLTLKPDTYDIVGKGLESLVERPLTDARFEFTSNGADLYVEFEDLKGRLIRIKVREGNTKKRHPFSMLAPFPSSSEKSPSLPL